MENISPLYNPMFHGDNVSYGCETGYIFNGTHDMVLSADCINKTWEFDFPETIQCIRKFIIIL